MYAHGGRKVEAKGQQALDRKREQQKLQAALRAVEFEFEERVAKYSRPRRRLYEVVHHSWFDTFFMLVILTYALVLGVYNPLKADDVMPNVIITTAEPWFTVLFTIDMFSHLAADGFRRFFSDTWNILDTIFVGLGWLDFIPGFKSGLGMLRSIKLSRTLTKVKSMKMVVTALVKSIPGLGNVLALVTFMVFIFALFGLKIWTGSLQGRCIAYVPANGTGAGLTVCEQHRIKVLSVGSSADGLQYCDLALEEKCPTGYKCAYFGSPENGLQGFDNMGMALLTTFQAVTSEGWSPIMDALSDVSSAGLVFPYFGFLMVFGGLFVTNYLLAESCVVFQAQMANQKIAAGDKETQKASAKQGALSKLMAQHALIGAATKIQAAHRGAVTRRGLTAGVPAEGGPTGPMEEVQQAEQAMHMLVEVPDELAAQIIATGPSRCQQSRTAVVHFVESKSVDGFLTGCIMVNFLFLAVEHHDMAAWLDDFLYYANVVLTVIFAVEMVVKIYGYGLKGYFTDVFNCFDAFVVTTSVLELALSGGGGSVGVLRTLRLVRIMRSFKMIKSGSALRVIIETAIASVGAVANFGILLLLLMYIYALLGMNLFGGKLIGEDGQPPRGNFDSMFSSFIAVFQVATRENWHVHLYNAMNSEAGVGPAVIYFVTLLMLTNYILLALFMGTLLEKFNKHFQDVAKMDVGVAAVIIHAKNKLVSLIRRKRKRTSTAVESAPAPHREDKACYVFKKSGCFRTACVRIIEHTMFERVIITSIIISSILLAVEHPNDKDHTTKAIILQVLDVIFTGIFTVECFLKIVAMGFASGQQGGQDTAYLKTWWNVLDMSVVIISVLNIVLPILNPGGDSSKMKFFRVLRTVRALRPLQAVKRWPGLRLVLRSIGNSIPSIVVVLMLALFFMLIFAIFFVQIYKGSLYSCLTDEPNVVLAGIPKAWCTGNFVGLDGSLHMRRWVNNRQNFDNTISALLIMFELLTLEEWNSVLILVSDATDPDHGPLRDNSPLIGIVFLFYIVAGSFFILNLFVGVIVTAYNEAKREADQKLQTNRNQEERRASRIVQTHDSTAFKYHKLHGATEGWRRPFSKIVLDSRFEWVILGAILLNVIFMTLEYTGDYMCPMNEDVESVSTYANEVFTFLFLGEALLKLAAFGVSKYLSENWNRFDGFIVTVSMAEFIVAKASDGGQLPLDPTIVRLFRIFRVARFVRVAEKAKGIKNLIQTFMETLPYLANVAALLTIFIFIYAVIGMALFSNVKHQTEISRHSNFESFAGAIGLLLRISTGEGWSGTMRDCQLNPGSPSDFGEATPCGLVLAEGSDVLRDNCGDALLAPLYFISYMLVCTYMSLNIIVAVILFTFFDLEGNPEDKSLDSETINDFLVACESYKVGGSSQLPATSVPALLRSVSDPLGCQTDWHLEQCMAALQKWMDEEMKRSRHIVVGSVKMPSIPPGITGDPFRASCDTLFRQIDADGDGRLTKKELKQGIDAIKSSTGLEHTAKQIFKSADTDGGGNLDADEFHEFMIEAVASSRAATEPYAEVQWNGRPIGNTKLLAKPYPDFQATFAGLLKRTRGKNNLKVDMRLPGKGASESRSLGQLNVEITGNVMKPAQFQLSKNYVRRTPNDGVPPSADLTASADLTSSQSADILTVSVADASFGCDDESSMIDIAVLLRFLIVFQFDVDVSPPPKQRAGGNLWGQLSGSKVAPGDGGGIATGTKPPPNLQSRLLKLAKAGGGGKPNLAAGKSSSRDGSGGILVAALAAGRSGRTAAEPAAAESRLHQEAVAAINNSVAPPPLSGSQLPPPPPPSSSDGDGLPLSIPALFIPGGGEDATELATMATAVAELEVESFIEEEVQDSGEVKEGQLGLGGELLTPGSDPNSAGPDPPRISEPLNP